MSPFLSKIFDVPQRVNVRCEIGFGGRNFIRHSCPTENGVFSSPYIFKKNKKFYLVGIHHSGNGRREEKFYNNHNGSATCLLSAAFCKDYEKACGKPCLTLEKVLSI